MTNIEWVRNPSNETQGISVNSKTGCLNHEEGLCKGGGFPCYAYKLAHGRLKSRYLANNNVIMRFSNGYQPMRLNVTDPFHLRFWPERLKQIRKIKKPTGIFLNDMSDWMGDYWPQEWTEMELQLMKDCPQHRFYTLTKQPQQLPQWSPFPDNAWVGVTATNQESYYDGVSNIAKVEAKVKFVSFEPLLEQINGGECAEEYRLDSIDEFDWLVIGACTGSSWEMVHLGEKYNRDLTEPSAMTRLDTKWALQPRIEWVREIVEAADKAGVKVFLKNNLKPLLLTQGLQDNRFWRDLRDAQGLESLHTKLRQEMPETERHSEK